MTTVSHVDAVGPFHLVVVFPKFHPSTDALVGMGRYPLKSSLGICTYGFAVLMARRFYTEDSDDHLEIRDSLGREVFQDSRYDLLGRRLPEPPRAPRDPNDIPF